MPLESKKDRPLRAGIDKAASDGDRTVTSLWVFGRCVRMQWVGTGHRIQADMWVADWEQHLDNEWRNVRMASAGVLQMFEAALVEQGVSEEVITTAARRALSHARA